MALPAGTSSAWIESSARAACAAALTDARRSGAPWKEELTADGSAAGAHLCDATAYSTTPVSSSASSRAIQTVTELFSSGRKLLEMYAASVWNATPPDPAGFHNTSSWDRSSRLRKQPDEKSHQRTRTGSVAPARAWRPDPIPSVRPPAGQDSPAAPLHRTRNRTDHLRDSRENATPKLLR
eukprot:scaffold7993_cov239-Pinguiococcus_pyrenoidosus.AAC.1